MREIIEQAKTLAENGSREIVFSGIQLGFYKDPDGQAPRLESLIAQVLDETDGFRIRFGSILPRHLTAGLIDLFDKHRNRLCPHFHVSLQSGDDDILKAMKRPYRAKHFRELMLELWTRLDQPCLGTDVIAGFPGESDQSFESTVELLEDLPMAYGHVFPFSMRPGTPAETLGDTVPSIEKKSRVARLRALFEEKHKHYLELQIGTEREVLIERRHSPEWLRGSTENYQQLLIPDGKAAIGELLKVKVSGLKDGMLFHESQKQKL
jgi:threonylcarbamoyladenosine tRNA methylthiotransferase MtaB